jgi:serine protease Do
MLASGILALGLLGSGIVSPGSQAAPVEEPTVTTDGMLGLGLATLSPIMASTLGLGPDTRGAVVTEVLDGSPAAQAGLQSGDVITEIDQKAISSADEAARQLGDHRSHLLRVKNARGSRLLTMPPA